MRPAGTPEQLQRRRRRAVRLLQAGRPMAAVARQVQASVSSVWRWWQTYQRAGPRGLQPRPTPGRPPRLSAAQQRPLERILAQGPRRAGYPTDLWTLARVASDPAGVRDWVSPQPCLEAAHRPRLAVPAA